MAKNNKPITQGRLTALTTPFSVSTSFFSICASPLLLSAAPTAPPDPSCRSSSRIRAFRAPTSISCAARSTIVPRTASHSAAFFCSSSTDDLA